MYTNNGIEEFIKFDNFQCPFLTVAIGIVFSIHSINLSGEVTADLLSG
jgi:hypothetical protein